MLRPALEAAANQGDLVVALASSLYAAGRYREARDACLRAAALGQQHFVFYQTLGWACYLTGRLADAETAMRRAVEIEPENSVGHFGIGAMLQDMKRHAEAAGFLERAVDAQPANILYLINLAACYFDLENFGACEATLRRAVAADKSSALAWNNLGVVLSRQERLDEAIEAYWCAERLERDTGADAANFVHFCIDLREAGNTREALELYESRLPDYPNPTAQAQYAHALLGAGRLSEGWSHMEYRWLVEPLNSARLKSGGPVWCGQDLRGKTILLRGEQGFGDCIQFLRYAPAVKALGATVCLIVTPGFEKIARLCPGVDTVLEMGSTIDFDYYIPLMSLPRVMGTDIDSIPADIPYLRAATQDVSKWAPRFAPDGMLKVGLSWAGSPGHLRDRYRSIALRQLSELSEVSGVRFHSLQKGRAAEEVASGAMPLVDLGPDLVDLCDTAAVIEQMDLLICVDTSVAHLAGALGKPVWVMLPQPADWRWLEEREDSPWYPTMRLFRQRVRRDWAEVIGRVKAALQETVERREQDPSRAREETPPRLPARNEAPAVPPQGAAPGIRPGFCGAAETRVGILQYLPHDDPVGKSLDWYGEYLQPQLDLLGKLLRPGSTVLEVGAGIGVHALYLAQRLGPEGHLLASEARPVLQRMLRQNLPANGASNVTVLSQMVGGLRGETEMAESVDGLQLEQLILLMVGEDVDSLMVLEGAQETLWRLRPLLLAAAEDETKVQALAGRARAFGYRCWKMVVPLFNPDNFNRRDDDIFGGRAALALLAIPEELDVEVVLDHCTEMS
jgi:tetratricopeptide (TPR) repeat protein/precorrin-6B methylase 2